MKLKTAIIVLLGLIYVSPLSAEYSKMNQVLENYSPPSFYKDSLTHKSAVKKSIDKPETISGERHVEIDNLIIRLEKDLEIDQKRGFLSNIDTTEFLILSTLSNDLEAVEQRVGRQLNLKDIEVIAGLRNPAVLAAQKKVTAELESFNQIMDLDQNLEQYSAFTEGINNKVGPIKMKASIKQKFPYPGLTSLKSKIIGQQVSALVEKMKIAQKNIITDTRKAYWDLVFVERSIEITAETIDAFNRLNDVANSLYKSGKTSFQDIIKINIKIEILKENLITLSSKKENIKVKLRELLNLPLNTKLGNVTAGQVGKKIPPPEHLYTMARQTRQELKVVRHQISKVQSMIEMAESMIQSPFTLNLSTYEDEAINSVGTDAQKPSFSEKTMVAMKNSNPIKPWYGIDNPWLNQTRLNLLSMKQTLLKMENATDRMVRDAWFSADKNNRELALYKNRILPLSKSALDVSTREYESGSIPFSQAIGSYTDWLKIKLTIAKKQTDLGISTATLEKTIGTSF